MKMPLAGGTPTTLASARSTLQAMVVDATGIYWAPASPIVRVPKSGGTPIRWGPRGPTWSVWRSIRRACTGPTDRGRGDGDRQAVSSTVKNPFGGGDQGLP